MHRCTLKIVDISFISFCNISKSVYRIYDSFLGYCICYSFHLSTNKIAKAKRKEKNENASFWYFFCLLCFHQNYLVRVVHTLQQILVWRFWIEVCLLGHFIVLGDGKNKIESLYFVFFGPFFSCFCFSRSFFLGLIVLLRLINLLLVCLLYVFWMWFRCFSVFIFYFVPTLPNQI